MKFFLDTANLNEIREGAALGLVDGVTTNACSLAKGKLDGTTVTCPCHGSQFDVTSGAVLSGPAQRPERSRLVQVEGDDLPVES